MLDIRRHMELFDPDTFTTPIHVIGAGATGSWLVLMLAKLGIKGDLIHVYDFDNVEEHNIPNQLFNQHNIGHSKVESLYAHLKHAVGVEIKRYDKRFESGRLNGYVFLMVDSMHARKVIFDNSIKMKSAVKHLIEPRMGLSEARIYNVNPMDLEQIRRYEDCWYSDEEAEVSSCGTSQTVITTAMTTASWCARQLINHHAGVELHNEILLDLQYNNIYPTKW